MKMKCLLSGGLGVILGVLAIARFDPSLEYTGRGDTSAMILTLRPVLMTLQATALKQKSLSHLHYDFDQVDLKNAGIHDIHMSAAGEIVVKGGKEGQMLVISPTFEGDKVVWHCGGGPRRDMPNMCRDGGVIHLGLSS